MNDDLDPFSLPSPADQKTPAGAEGQSAATNSIAAVPNGEDADAFYDDFDEADDTSLEEGIPAQSDDDPPFDVEDDFDRKVAQLGGAAPIRETVAPIDAEADVDAIVIQTIERLEQDTVAPVEATENAAQDHWAFMAKFTAKDIEALRATTRVHCFECAHWYDDNPIEESMTIEAQFAGAHGVRLGRCRIGTPNGYADITYQWPITSAKSSCSQGLHFALGFVMKENAEPFSLIRRDRASRDLINRFVGELSGGYSEPNQPATENDEENVVEEESQFEDET